MLRLTSGWVNGVLQKADSVGSFMDLIRADEVKVPNGPDVQLI
jgi:hypothetical protein